MSTSSNNSTFTIKSAPARTPSVLTPLATHSGWLEKKDESGNWNLRFVAAVPHTFLYYFSSDSPTAQPTGIIDLECYTNVIRTPSPPLPSSIPPSSPSILHLCGETSINPNLRSFYFRTPTSAVADLWTGALLGGRHHELLESLSAFKELQGGYSEQLNACNDIAAAAEARGRDAAEELYRARQGAEGWRGEVKRGVMECVKIIGGLGEGSNGGEGGGEGEEQRRAVKRVMKLAKEGDVGGMMDVVVGRVKGQKEELERTRGEVYDLRFEVTKGRAERDVEVAEVKKRAKEREEEVLASGRRAEEAARALAGRMEDLERSREATSLEFNILKGQKEKADRKRREAGEHKRILVKEVIAQRGRVEYYAERNRLLEASVDRKKEGIKGMREQIRELKEKLVAQERLLQAMV
ncbi:hypothetical protein TrRE_jg6270, partial [Triparma retinervis]